MLINILDVGSGIHRKVPDAITMDNFEHDSIDICHDVNVFPWPILDQSVQKIVFCHSISHFFDVISVIEECYRILKIGGTIEIVAPHFSSDNYYSDPTIRHSFGLRSMNYFCHNVDWEYKYVAASNQLHLSMTRISFRECETSWRQCRKFNLLRYLGIEALINFLPRWYEKFFCWMLPCGEVYFLLKKTKRVADV